MKTTVTQDASVASASSIEQALDSGFLPTDREYRKTGKFAASEDRSQADKSDEEEQQEYEQQLAEQDADQDSDQDGARRGQQDSASSGAQDGDRAASQAATEQERSREQAQQRTRQQGESRWAKLSRENRELREKLARVEGRQEARTETSAQRETQQASQSAAVDKATPRPKIDDVDEKTGKPKYATYADYEAAKDQWLQDEAIRKFQETNARTERERAQQQAVETVNREFARRCEAVMKDMPDFQEVALNPDLPIKQGSVADVFILSRPAGPKVLYYLGQNPDVLDQINGMNQIDAAYALSEIEMKVSGARSASSSARSVTQAPRPPHQVSGKGTVAKDTVDDAIEHQDQSAYNREQNSRDPRLLAVRRSRK